ncbi:efflux RND transporter periplasmic adaptor subunit [Carnobacterium gallinarum]|uniref:efflux RND transporter periplasmic adaptor subunit n=1 Tax=Carnobacterium gallinarum TaxID=2749 RepID=UPI00054E283D|nr:transporter [Carnobacterium gallinarum]
MKKKWMIGIVIGIVAIVGITVAINMAQPKQNISKEPKDDGIEYFTLPDVDQVYINGVVTPDQTEAFTMKENLDSNPEIKVNNGDVVEADTVLFTYEDKAVTKEMEEGNRGINKGYTQRGNAIVKRDRDLANVKAETATNPETGETVTSDTTAAKNDIRNAAQDTIDSIDQDIQSLNDQVVALAEKQYTSVTAKFKGRVSIPEVKEANAPVLRLTSEGFYIAGKVNEKDLSKIKLDQKADIKVVSNGNTATGKIAFIDDNPPDVSANDAEGGGMGGSTGMSSYLVKVSLDSLEGIKNGYHVQSTINLSNELVKIPTEAIHEDGDKKYVLVNDFGSVIRREVVLGEVEGKNTTVQSGLESADKIIVSSKKEVKEGDILENNDSTGEQGGGVESK